MKAAGKRRKGNAGERELVKLLNGAHIIGRTLTARRVPLSGAMSATGFGGDILVGEGLANCASCCALNRDEGMICSLHMGESQWEVKRRAQGFQRIYDWLKDCQVLAFRTDCNGWLVCMRLEDYVELKK